MRIERIEHFITGERFLVTEGAFRLATGVASRQLPNGFPVGYVQPDDVVHATTRVPLIIMPLTTISVHPEPAPAPSDILATQEQLYTRLMTLEWPVKRRVAWELVTLAQLPKLSQQQRNGVAIPLTQAQLAQLVGVTRAAVAATLREFVRTGVVRTEYGRIVITDMPLLRHGAAQQ